MVVYRGCGDGEGDGDDDGTCKSGSGYWSKIGGCRGGG